MWTTKFRGGQASCRHLNSARYFVSSSRLTTQVQNRLPASYYRGGTSRAVFFNQNDLPGDRRKWDPIFRGVIGSPDPHGRQLDGLGGGISSLSKVCVVGPSSREDADVDYTFAALGIKNSDVDYSSNCGNMTSAVGPFAVDSGLVRSEGPEAVVRIHNTNTGKIIHATFPTAGTEAASSGDFSIDGVTGAAARIQLNFVDPAGAKTGKLLPTGNVIDSFDGIDTTCIDVGNPCCFVKAKDLGVAGDMSPGDIDADSNLLDRLDSIRRQAGVAMGIASSTEKVPGSIPKIGFVSPVEEESGADLAIRALSVGNPHRAVPITVALSVATAARLPGSTVAQSLCAKPAAADGTVIAHPSGKLMVGAEFDDKDKLLHATVFRTARRIMEGTVFWKPEE